MFKPLFADPNAMDDTPLAGEEMPEVEPHPIATPEPDPIEGSGDVWAEVIADTEDPALRALFEARRQFGIDKYGRPLQRDNGRDHENDLRQELADAIVYARAADMPATEAVLTALLAGGEDAARRILKGGVSDTLDVWLMQVGGNPPEATFSALVSKEEAQRLGRSPGLYGRVTVLLPADVKGEP